MALHPPLPEPASRSTPPPPGAALETVPRRLVYGVLVLLYAGLIALISLLSGFAVVSLGTFLPSTLPTTLLLWAMALGAVSASPPFARWLLRRLLARD
jgi:hypothetical protein